MEENNPKKAASDKIPALDGLRGLAIAAVMLSHFLWKNEWQSQTWWKLLQGGWLGVDLFFVLSGFLITNILLHTRNRSDYFPRFYKRRALRIFPLYYAAILITWLVMRFVEHHTPDYHRGYDSYAWYTLFVPNIAMALKGDWLYSSNLITLNHLWSLAVEEQYYLVWPLVVWLLPARWLGVLSISIVLTAPAIRVLTDQAFGMEWSLASYVMPFCRMDGLAAGSFLAICGYLNWGLPRPWGAWTARAAILVFGYRLTEMILTNSTQYRGSIASLLFAAILHRALNENPDGWVRRFLEQRWLQHLGAYSYGLYVFHQMFEYFWGVYWGEQVLTVWMPAWAAQGVYVLLSFTATYILARLSWLLLEKQFLRFK